MPDVKVERKVGMTRAEVAEWIADVGKALSGEGTVSIRLADTTVHRENRCQSGPQEWRRRCVRRGRRLIRDR